MRICDQMVYHVCDCIPCSYNILTICCNRNAYIYKYCSTLRDSTLPPPCIWGLGSSGTLRNVYW